MEAINNYDLKDVYCPYKQGQCVSTCAMLMYDSDSIYIGTHSWEDEDGYPCQAGVYRRYTDYWCGIAHAKDGECANKTRIHGILVCDGKPFDGMTDEKIQELAEVREKLAEMRGKES